MVEILNQLTRESLFKMVFWENLLFEYLQEGQCRKREQQVQGPWGETMPDEFEEQWGSHMQIMCYYHGVSFISSVFISHSLITKRLLLMMN